MIQRRRKDEVKSSLAFEGDHLKLDPCGFRICWLRPDSERQRHKAAGKKHDGTVEKINVDALSIKDEGPTCGRAAQKTLHQAAGIIQDKAKGAVRIEGHTDSKGNDAYNQKRSERRATSVKTCFVDKEGLGKVQFSTQGFGAKKPVASNTKPDGSDDPAGRQKNRRVEIIIRKS